jgi:hypothetical protein
MRLGTLEITFHRTVRVPDGRQPSNLPPSLGRIKLYPVSKYAERCPKNWEPEGYFMALHDTEAMWMSFTPRHPVALLVGAGGINALNGEKLGTTLAKENYVVAPPQPWLDGWKDADGTVYQFVATPYKKGEGLSVAEQLMGRESKTGAIGIALFDPKDVKALKPVFPPLEGYSGSIMGNDFLWTQTAGEYTNKESLMDVFGKMTKIECSAAQEAAEKEVVRLTKSRALGAGLKFTEMGIGRGGKIVQKIYPDPYGLDIWQVEPSATLVTYLVNAKVFEQITWQKVPEPVGHEMYQGHWFGIKDSQHGDIAGTKQFSGLKSAVFPASDLEDKEEKPEPAAVAEKP